MAVSLSPLFNPDSAQIDANGDPRTGGKLFTYTAGTSTKVTTYQDSAGATPHTNPIVLSSNGLPPAPLWLTQGSTYKYILAASTDTDPPASAILTIDNITGINDITSVATTEWTASGMSPTYLSASSFWVTGDQTTTLNVGRRLKMTESGASLYGTIIKSTYTSVTTVTVLLDSGTLSSDFTGNDFWYGINSAANTSVPFISRDQQCGRLVYVSTTQIKLEPQDGNTIWVYTAAGGWARRTIRTAAGEYVAGANTNTYVNGVSGQTLSAAGVTYYVYLFDLSGVLTMDFSTTAPAVDATSGLKIKPGDPTRLLIGMVRPDGSSQFQTPALVLSWYKRRAIKAPGTALTGPPTTTSTSAVELQAAAQAKFLSWAEEAILAQFTGYSYMDAVGRTANTRLTLDGIVTEVSPPVTGTSYAANAQDNASCCGYATVTEGYHYVTITVLVNAGTGTWATGGILSVLTQG